MPNTVQHRRRLGALGAPPTLLQGQFGLNDPGFGNVPNLYGGGDSGVVNIVGPSRQVYLALDQTIVGNKTIDVDLLHIEGGAPGYILSTNGTGGLSWVPGDGSLPSPGGTVTGDINFTGDVTINGIPVVADAPADGRLYVRGNESWIILPWTTDGGAGTGPGGGVPEAPSVANVLYGRTGVGGGSWQPVLPMSGGNLVGPLVLDGPPTAVSPPNAAATKGYVDALITGALQFLGTMDATTGIVTYTTSSGYAPGQLVPASIAKDQYVLVAVAGTVPGGPIAGQTVGVLDWIISDGVVWRIFRHTQIDMLASNVELNPPFFGQTDVQGAFDYIETTGIGGIGEAPTDGRAYLRDGLAEDWVAGLPLAGGTMTGGLVLDGPPTQTDQAATKGYVDLLVAGTHNPMLWGQGDWGADNWGGAGGGAASTIVVAPSVLGQSNVQGALQSLISYVDDKPAVRVSTVSPPAPVDGVLWYDSNNVRLMVYVGTWIQVA